MIYKSWAIDKPYSIFRLHLVRYNLGKTVKKWISNQISRIVGLYLGPGIILLTGTHPRG